MATYISRCAQLTRDLKELDLIKSSDFVEFKINEDGSFYYYVESDSNRFLHVEQHLDQIRIAFFIEFEELRDTYEVNWSEWERGKLFISKKS